MSLSYGSWNVFSSRSHRSSGKRKSDHTDRRFTRSHRSTNYGSHRYRSGATERRNQSVLHHAKLDDRIRSLSTVLLERLHLSFDYAEGNRTRKFGKCYTTSESPTRARPSLADSQNTLSGRFTQRTLRFTRFTL